MMSEITLQEYLKMMAVANAVYEQEKLETPNASHVEKFKMIRNHYQRVKAIHDAWYNKMSEEDQLQHYLMQGRINDE